MSSFFFVIVYIEYNTVQTAMKTRKTRTVSLSIFSSQNKAWTVRNLLVENRIIMK